MNDVLKYLYHRYVDGPRRWYPFLSVYYLTYACDFRCPYCSDGAGRPYYTLPAGGTPSAGTAARIIDRIRACVDFLVVTGGEPLQHPEFGDIIRHAGRRRFRNLAVTTNGHQVDVHLEAIASAVDTLVVSVDTLDERKADGWYGIGPGAFAKIRDNLERAAAIPGRRFEIVLSAVATPDNLPDLHEVYDFSQRRGFTFAAAPQLAGVKAAAGLGDADGYRRFFDHLAREKERGRRIFGTPPYLRAMRDLAGFRCRPFTMLVVAPGGEAYYPCLEIGNLAGSLLDAGSLHDLRVAAERRFGPPPRCDVRCHSACALSFALAFDDLLPAVRDGIRQLRSRPASPSWKKMFCAHMGTRRPSA